MLSPRDDQLPIDACRDLLGIVRSIYTSEAKAGAGALRLALIADVGLGLAKAIELARRYKPGTMGHCSAWKFAEESAREMGDLVEPWSTAQPILQAAMRAVTRQEARQR